jgi:hypothetical protein
MFPMVTMGQPHQIQLLATSQLSPYSEGRRGGHTGGERAANSVRSLSPFGERVEMRGVTGGTDRSEPPHPFF